ncbi:MAG: hypothetical protein QXS79_05650 [Candidatus Bathyarchaeia archaeon]
MVSILGVLGVLGSLYLFGLKAVTTSLVRDMIGLVACSGLKQDGLWGHRGHE